MSKLGYWDLIISDMTTRTSKHNTTGLSKAIVNQRFKKEKAKVECLVKAIEKHKEETPDDGVRICDQKLWSAGEMINYGK